MQGMYTQSVIYVFTGIVGKPAGYISEHSDDNSSSAVEFNFFSLMF